MKYFNLIYSQHSSTLDFNNKISISNYKSKIINYLFMSDLVIEFTCYKRSWLTYRDRRNFSGLVVPHWRPEIWEWWLKGSICTLYDQKSPDTFWFSRFVKISSENARRFLLELREYKKSMFHIIFFSEDLITKSSKEPTTKWNFDPPVK